MFDFRQTEEMRLAVETLETGSTEKSISEMAGRHFEEMSLLQGHWGSRVDALKLEQKRQYRNWIMRLLEEQQTSMLSTPVYVFHKFFKVLKNPLLKLCNSNIVAEFVNRFLILNFIQSHENCS